jgi:hypothetical protein
MVMAADKFGNVITSYTGTVDFSSNDHQAVLPANYTFTAADDGVHTFQATLRTAGLESIIATDTVTTTLTGKQTGIVITPGAAVKLLVTASPTTQTAGTQFDITVAAKDFYGNVASSYTGTIGFTSSDKKATLPALDYTFTSSDLGVHSFPVTLNTVGTMTITATDTLTSSITGKVTITVVAPPGPGFQVVAAPTLVTPSEKTPEVHRTAPGGLTAAAIDQVMSLVDSKKLTRLSWLKHDVKVGVLIPELAIDRFLDALSY